MNKKLLIGGSAIVVVVLVLASLSPVVGFHTVKSSAKDSPLFSIRTKRAIDKKGQSLNCEYIGKGQICTFYLPSRNRDTDNILKIIDAISKMDDREFNRYINLATNHLQRKNAINTKNINKAITILRQLKDNPDEVKKYVVLNDESPTTPVDCPSMAMTNCGTPIICLIVFAWALTLMLLTPLFLFFYLITAIFTCMTYPPC